MQFASVANSVSGGGGGGWVRGEANTAIDEIVPSVEAKSRRSGIVEGNQWRGGMDGERGGRESVVCVRSLHPRQTLPPSFVT